MTKACVLYCHLYTKIPRNSNTAKRRYINGLPAMTRFWVFCLKVPKSHHSGLFMPFCLLCVNCSRFWLSNLIFSQ